MNKLLLWTMLMLSPLLLIGQDSMELPVHSLTASANKAPIILHVYPTPIIDQFRIDLREFKGQQTKIEVIRRANEEVIYSRQFTPQSNSIQLSAYAIGMIREEYNVRMTCNGSTYEKAVVLD